jgi:hypothetical protein
MWNFRGGPRVASDARASASRPGSSASGPMMPEVQPTLGPSRAGLVALGWSCGVGGGGLGQGLGKSSAGRGGRCSKASTPRDLRLGQPRVGLGREQARAVGKGRGGQQCNGWLLRVEWVSRHCAGRQPWRGGASGAARWRDHLHLKCGNLPGISASTPGTVLCTGPCPRTTPKLHVARVREARYRACVSLPRKRWLRPAAN